jgi:hypothetical protein
MTDDKPLITHLFTADPSAHVLMEKYTSIPHDIATDIQDNDNGDQYAMEDYGVFSLSKIGGPVTDHGTVLSASSVPWVSKQMWRQTLPSRMVYTTFISPLVTTRVFSELEWLHPRNQKGRERANSRKLLH